jgi:hypothetical protein
MDIYRLKAAFTDPDHAPHWYLEHSDEHGITLAWLAYPTPEAGWRFEQHDRYRGRMPATATGIPSGAWEDLQAMLQAFAYQRCGIRAPGEPKPAPPAVRWERAPFRWVGPYQWQGWKVRYEADPPVLTINATWWRKVGYQDHLEALRQLPGDPLGPCGSAWLYELAIRKDAPRRRPAPAA